MDRHFVNVRYFDCMKDQELLGLLIEFDRQLRRIKISHEEGMDWISWDDILDIQFLSDER